MEITAPAPIKIMIDCKGKWVNAEVIPENDCYGRFYTVHLEGKHAYTLHHDSNQWLALRAEDLALSLPEHTFLQRLTRQLDQTLNQ